MIGRLRARTAGWGREEGGQAVVMLALSLTGLLASVGLVMDAGYAISRTRVHQNAVDAAALVGARAVARGDWLTIDRDIKDYAERNGIPDSNGIPYDGVNTNVTWAYVNNAGDTTTQALATGVRVEATQSLTTRFLSVIGITTIPISRRSTALVEAVTGLGATAPFAVYELQGPTDLFTHDGAGQPNGLNPSALGQTFQIHGPQIAHPFHSDSFKGLLPTDHGPLTVGDSIAYDPGVRAGPTRDEVRAIGTPYIVLPIFDARDAAVDKVHVVGFAVFEVVETAANKHSGRLIPGTFFVSGTGTPTWVPGSTFDVATLKLVN
ncbi:MAG: hypothetical protein NVS9B6_09540 [Candidatus Limnocylindrales bacterium]